MEILGRHWIVALATALLLHLGLAVVLLGRAPDSGAQGLGMGGIEVSLGSAGAPPGAALDAASDLPEAETPAPKPVVPTPEDAAEPLSEGEPTVPETPPPYDGPVAETTAAKPVETIEATASAQPPIEPLASAELLARAEKSLPLPQRPPPRAPPQKTSAAQGPQEDKAPPVRPSTSQAETAPETSPAQTARVAGTDGGRVSAQQGISGETGSLDKPDTGSGKSSAGGAPGLQADYGALLSNWLNKHKRYPRRARMRGQEGTARLLLRLDQDGALLEYRIEATSGHRLLDHEILDMIERAKPLPKPPEEIGSRGLVYSIPVVFSLN